MLKYKRSYKHNLSTYKMCSYQSANDHGATALPSQVCQPKSLNIKLCYLKIYIQMICRCSPTLKPGVRMLFLKMKTVFTHIHSCFMILLLCMLVMFSLVVVSSFVCVHKKRVSMNRRHHQMHQCTHAWMRNTSRKNTVWILHDLAWSLPFPFTFYPRTKNR